MADSKISSLSSATTPLAGTELCVLVQSSTTVQATVQDIADLAASSNIGNSDLTIDSSGDRKLVMAGALSTDRFVVRNSADSADLFVIQGNGVAYSSGAVGDNRNTAYGLDALGALTTGLLNTAVGYQAGDAMTTQGNSTFMGYQAGSAVNGGDGTYVGYQAGLVNTNGIGITSVGSKSLVAMTSGNYHTAVGFEALGALPGGTTGSVGLGWRAGKSITSGVATASYGIFIGYDAGKGVTTARENIFIGSGKVGACGITSAYENTVIGNQITGLSNTNGQVVLTNGAGEFAIHRDSNGNIILGDQSALATTATDGFNYVRGGAGAPTGTPATSITGHVPMYADTTNNKLYIYSGGAWQALN